MTNDKGTNDKGMTKWHESRLEKKISFRGTVRKTAVPCGFREGKMQSRMKNFTQGADGSREDWKM